MCEYLKSKSECDCSTKRFYLQKRWRNWRFRLYCKRKSNNDKLMNSVEKVYGKDCIIFYGGWSAAESLRGCAPSPTSSLRKLFESGWLIVDEFRTSSICNVCHYKLEKYRKRDGKLSYARLCCRKWTREKEISKDLNNS